MPQLSRSSTATAVAACLAWLLVPSLAFAGTAQLDDPPDGGPNLTFTAASGETNRLLLLFAPGGYRVIDFGAAITAGPGCSAVSSSEVFCAFTLDFDEPPAIDILLGDLNDFASVAGTFSDETTVDGEAGADELELSAGCELGFEAACNNVLLGGPGGDILRVVPGTGLFRMDGGAGGDLMEGGGIVDYSARVNPVIVDADGVADDGEAGEGDNVGPGFVQVLGGSAGDSFTGVNASGGAGDDTFTAGGNGHSFDGAAGDDVFVGSPASDFFEGGPGEDELNGGGGADDLIGGGGADTIRGGQGRDGLFAGSGNDLLIGGDGGDFLAAGPGDDEIRARDGVRDRIPGGRGFDRARVDRRLDLLSSIEAFF